MSWAYCAPKSTTRTVSKPPGTLTAFLGGIRVYPHLTCGNRRTSGCRGCWGYWCWWGYWARWVWSDAEAGDAAAVEFGHGDRMAGYLHTVPGGRQVAERGEDVARDGLVGPFGEFDPGLLVELVQVEQPVDLDLAAAQRGGRALL